MSDKTNAGRLEAIWIKRFRRGPMDAVDQAKVVAGRGLEGNTNQGGKRQVTLIAAERWQAVCRQLAAEIDPRTRRANLMLRGIDLEGSRGRSLQIGDCRIEIYGETRPCHLMDEAYPGLQQALDPEWRGGAFGLVLNDAEIRVGDPATWV